MRKFEYKYKIDRDKNTIVAMSTFAGKVVAGVARCAPADTFNVETGKELAAARCSLKIAEKRLKRAEDCLERATAARRYWETREAEMRKYDEDSVIAYQRALAELTVTEKKLCE